MKNFYKSKNLVLVFMLCLFFISISLYGQNKLYWVENNPNRVMSCNLDGTEVETVVDNFDYPTGLAVDSENEVLYIGLAGGANSVVKVNIDGSEPETLINTESPVSAIQLDLENGFLYYSLFSGNVIKKANLDGSNVEVAVEPSGSINDFLLDLSSGKLYWTEYFEGFVKRCNLDGSNVETLISSQSYPSHLFLDSINNKLYWTNYVGNNINCSNLDGSDHQVILSGLSYPTGITLDIANNHMYWVNYQAKTLNRANLDGTDIQIIFTATEEDIVMWTLKSNIPTTGISQDIVANIPITLNQNYPNPFNPTTSISFSLSESSQLTKLEIFNVKGQLVKTLVNSVLVSGTHVVDWDGKNDNQKPVVSGIYFYRLTTNKSCQIRKMILMK